MMQFTRISSIFIMQNYDDIRPISEAVNVVTIDEIHLILLIFQKRILKYM